MFTSLTDSVYIAAASRTSAHTTNAHRITSALTADHARLTRWYAWNTRSIVEHLVSVTV